MMRKFVPAIVFILIISYPFSISLKALDKVWHKRPYIDEMFWIPVSNIAFQDFFINHDFSQATWDREYYSWGNYNPTIGKFIMGLFIYCWGDSQWRVFAVKEGTEEFTDKIAFPTVETFVAARVPNFIFAYLACVLLFFVVYVCVGLKEGVLAAILFAYSPIVRFVSHLAVTDFYVMFFGLFSTLSFIFLIKGISRKSIPLVLGIYTPVVGLFAGLCIGSKLIGFLTLINIILLLTIAWFFFLCAPWLTGKFKSMQVAVIRKDSRWMFPSIAILAVVISLSIFIFSNPFLYRNTVDNLRHMYSHKAFLEKRFAPGISLKEKFTLSLGKRLLGDHHPFHIKKFHRLSILFNFVFTVIGFCFFNVLIAKEVNSKNYNNACIKIVLLSWCIIYLGGILWWAPKDWYRWLIPAVPPLAILESIGIVHTCRYVYGLLFKTPYFVSQGGD